MKYYYYILALLCIGVSACKKSSDATKAKTKTDYLTQKPWIAIAERANTDNGAWTETFSSNPACVKDNRLSFAANGVCINDEGATKCSASDPQTAQGTWTFTTNETRISISGIGGQGDFALQQLDDNTLVIVQQTVVSGHTYKSEGTYGHP